MRPEWRVSGAADQARLDPAGVTVVAGEGWSGRYERTTFGPGFHMHVGELELAAPLEQQVAAEDDGPPLISVYVPTVGAGRLQMLDWPELTLRPWTALLFTARERRSTFRIPGDQSFRFFSVALWPELFGSLFDDDPPPALAALLVAAGRTTLVHTRSVSAATRALIAEIGSPGDGGPLQRLHREAVAIRLLTEVVGATAAAPAGNVAARDAAVVRDARVAILSNLREPPSAAELAKAAGMGLRRFLRAFEDVHGATPAQLLRQERLAEARRLLEVGDAPLKEIAWRVGYAHVSNFVAAFTAEFGAPPRRFSRRRLAAE